MYDNSKNLDPVYLFEQFVKNWSQYAYEAYSHYKQFGRGAITLDFTRQPMTSAKIRPVMSYKEEVAIADTNSGYSKDASEPVAEYDPESAIVVVMRTGPEDIYVAKIMAEGEMRRPIDLYNRSGNLRENHERTNTMRPV